MRQNENPGNSHMFFLKLRTLDILPSSFQPIRVFLFVYTYSPTCLVVLSGKNREKFIYSIFLKVEVFQFPFEYSCPRNKIYVYKIYYVYNIQPREFNSCIAALYALIVCLLNLDFCSPVSTIAYLVQKSNIQSSEGQRKKLKLNCTFFIIHQHYIIDNFPRPSGQQVYSFFGLMVVNVILNTYTYCQNFQRFAYFHPTQYDA